MIGFLSLQRETDLLLLRFSMIVSKWPFLRLTDILLDED